jgi:hypothetical protein
MNLDYSNSLSNIINEFIAKKSLCMLLLASSILFLDMANKRRDKIPRPYALFISIILIVYAAILAIHCLMEFYFEINQIILLCSSEDCYLDITHIKHIKNFYLSMGILYSFILIFICYVLIRFD